YREKRAFGLGGHDSSANLGEVIGPLALGLLITFVDWRTALQIWAIPGLTIGLLYALFGGEERIVVPQRRDYRRALWEDVLKNKTVFSLVAGFSVRALGGKPRGGVFSRSFFFYLKISAALVRAGPFVLFFFFCR